MNKNVALTFNELKVHGNWVNQKTDAVTTESLIREQHMKEEAGFCRETLHICLRKEGGSMVR